jgi:hypothetical protein
VRSPMDNPGDSTHLARFSNLIRAWDASSPEPASSSFVAGCVLVRGRRPHPRGANDIPAASVTSPRRRAHSRGLRLLLLHCRLPRPYNQVSRLNRRGFGYSPAPSRSQSPRLVLFPLHRPESDLLVPAHVTFFREEVVVSGTSSVGSSVGWKH